MSEIRLTPWGHLRLDTDGDTESAKIPASLEQTFHADWREGLFLLAATKVNAASSATVRYWQEWAEVYLTRLCHVPSSATAIDIEPPTSAECAARLLMAPPMQGGEYLSEAVLRDVWHGLDAWIHEALAVSDGLDAFLAARAPRWHQVGRVCFHLAENKNDSVRPFAFMATYATGFGPGGQLKHLPLRKALEQYAGSKNRAALIKLLEPVQHAAERCAWVNELVETGGIYQPMAWKAERAYQFLRNVPELEASGLSVRMPNWWKKRARPQVSVTIGNQMHSGVGVGALLDFDIEVALGDETLTREDIEALLAGEDGLVLVKGQWVEVNREKLQQAIDHWEALREKASGDHVSFVEGMRLLAGASQDLKHEDRIDEDRAWVHVDAGDYLREILEGLREPGRLVPPDVDGMVRATLRPYQKEGLAWLRFVTGLGLGACLADDMGLGKTLQVLALLAAARQAPSHAPAPSLLVVPASLLANWRSEAARFAPELRLQFLHPSETSKAELDAIAKAPRDRLAGTDLVVTTYAMTTRQSWLADVSWRLVILDEAQAIKNPGTRQTRAVKKLPAQARIVLTGTPVENRLGDLWSLFDFLNPGLLGSAPVFTAFVKTLQQRTENQFAPLRRLVSPYILRRLKTDKAIIADLPEKTEMRAYCPLTKAQVRLYEQILGRLRSMLSEGVDDSQRRGLVLQSLMRFKQICNHPSQLTGDGGYAPEESGKFQRLAAICEELAERQEKVLIFTQFREIIEPLGEHLMTVFKRPGLILHGGTPVAKRRSIVEQFQDEDGPPFFVLSLKAGGTGLNLTAASHVIHFDRWWNPAVENQATDRAFRIGQKRNVLVHKFVTTGTIEERIDEMIANKQELANEILASSGEVPLTELSDDELLDMVRLDVTRTTL